MLFHLSSILLCLSRLHIYETYIEIATVLFGCQVYKVKMVSLGGYVLHSKWPVLPDNVIRFGIFDQNGDSF